jgi:hypothetical protein
VKYRKTFLLDEPTNKQRAMRSPVQPRSITKDICVHTILNYCGRASELGETRNVVEHARADENNLVRGLHYATPNGAVREALNRSKRTLRIGHLGDVLSQEEGSLQPTSGKHGHEVQRIQAIVYMQRV